MKKGRWVGALVSAAFATSCAWVAAGPGGGLAEPTLTPVTSGAPGALTKRGEIHVGAAVLADTARTARVHAGSVAAPVAFYTFQAPGGQYSKGRKVIALTFDDGPGIYTPQVLSVLEKYHVPATFFEIGEHVAEFPQYTRLVSAAGYPVEDHTWSHPDLTTIPISQFPYQIDQTQTEIRSVTGHTPNCVRPPGDTWNSTVLDQLGQRGLTTMSYSIDPKDWTVPGVSAIVARVVGSAFPGGVVDLHDAGGPRDQTVAALPEIISQLRAEGYGFVSICGGQYGSSLYRFGSVIGSSVSALSPRPFVSMARTADGKGSWLTTADGRIFCFGDAHNYGSMGNVHLNQPIVAIAATPTGNGYWLTAADGGIFTFGDARYHGSTGNIHLNQPIVAIAATPTGNGYWLTAADGGIFTFGDARYHGSTGNIHLNQPIVAIAATPTGNGYWLTAADGGIFTFGDARYHGSTGNIHLNQPIVAIAATATGNGYWLTAADGGIFTFGDAHFYGSAGGVASTERFFAMVAGLHGAGYLLAAQHSA